MHILTIGLNCMTEIKLPVLKNSNLLLLYSPDVLVDGSIAAFCCPLFSLSLSPSLPPLLPPPSLSLSINLVIVNVLFHFI